jgi:endoribonuclease Dicer
MHRTELRQGDAYLKYLASIYVFVTHPTQSEGALHTIRQRIVSNKALLANASRTGMPQYIQSKPLTPKIWAPPNFYVPDHPGTQKRVSNSNDSGNSGQSPQEITPKGAVGADSESKGQSAGDSTSTVGATFPVNKHGTKPSGDGGDDNTPAVTAPKPVNQAQKKRPQAEANIQLLGDKVCLLQIHSGPGQWIDVQLPIHYIVRRRCCGGYHWGRLRYRWPGGSAEGDESTEHSRPTHRQMV